MATHDGTHHGTKGLAHEGAEGRPAGGGGAGVSAAWRGRVLIGADMPIDTARFPVRELLGAFRVLVESGEDVHLLLAGRRCKHEIYSVWNELDRHGLTGRADYLPYDVRCERFPVKKRDVDVWVGRHTPASVLDAAYLRGRVRQATASRAGGRSGAGLGAGTGGEAGAGRWAGGGAKQALFFTSFHPMKAEGNSRLMRGWLDHLRGAGYAVHVAYYAYDLRGVPAELRRAAMRAYDLYTEIPVESRLTGSNYDGLNLHVDDWCGAEALEAVSRLVERTEYDLAITNYAFMSAVLERVASYTTRVLLTHDSFVDRNRKMLAQGYFESAWMSVDERGEALACARADVVVAMQEAEASHFRAVMERPEAVRVIAPIFDAVEVPDERGASRGGRLRVGYFGSSNWVNEQNLGEYMKRWAADSVLRERAELVIGGAVCETLSKFVPAGVLAACGPRMIGRVERPAEFYGRCDLVINPERGGTGIKIKTLEALAHGAALLTTAAGSVGIEPTDVTHEPAHAAAHHPGHRASGFDELIEWTRRAVEEPGLVDELRGLSRAMHAAHVATHRARMDALLGPVVREEEAAADAPAAASPTVTGAGTGVGTGVAMGVVRAEVRPAVRRDRPALVVPGYVREHGAAYHTEEFERVFERVEVRGASVLEIGSDYHLASARLFAANGAARVVATNLANWRSDEPLPPGVEFRVCDAADAGFEDASFDIIYGIAVLEHIVRYHELVPRLRRWLKPGGIAYLQGCPLWTGAVGHHVWYQAPANADGTPGPLYSFTGNNPIPNWSHLTVDAAGMVALLVGRGVPREHAEGIAQYVYNTAGVMRGSCSNFLSGGAVLDELVRGGFDVAADRIWTRGEGNEHFAGALASHSEDDLRTLGLQVWMRPAAQVAGGGATGAGAAGRRRPKVSVIVPFYNVEAYIEACLKSVAEQTHRELEVLLVDDASGDGSRRVAERFAARDDRFTILAHERNRGLGPARDTGVDAATGDYVFFLDSDDLLASPDAITRLVEHAEAGGHRVVVGSAEQLTESGQRTDYDRRFDGRWSGRPGAVIDGESAYLGASFIPGGSYVPMRAWGTLIDRFFYLETGLRFPTGRHEDLAHTPFLYAAAGRVLYAPEIAVTYRLRAQSLSTRAWGAAEIAAYAGVWREIRANIMRLGLERHLGDTAIKTAEHLVMKLRGNGMARSAEEAAFATLEAILADAGGPLKHDLLFPALDSLRGVLDLRRYDHTLYHRLTRGIDPAGLVAYYRRRVSEPAATLGALRLVDDEPAGGPVVGGVGAPAGGAGIGAGVGAASQVEVGPIARASVDKAARERNDEAVAAMLAEFKRLAPARVQSLPSMLTEGDRALYFRAGREFAFNGSIVDAGCFVGGTTLSLVAGLLANPLADRKGEEMRGLVRVYDLFRIDDSYILGHLRQHYPSRELMTGGSFLEIFTDNLREHAAMLDVRAGDVMAIGYPDAAPIAVLGLDLCKALPITDHVLRRFFPRLVPDALVIHQDFIHPYHPHIHLSVARLGDHLRRDVEIRWGGSVSYRCVRPVTADTIRERFGPDESWYRDERSNVRLLRELAASMLYDENRWVVLLTLAVYHWSLGQLDQARAVYDEARERFPKLEPDETLQRMIQTAVTR